MTRHHPRSRRAAYTLVELLVVILIIVVLVSLVAAGIFATMGSRQATATTEFYGALNRVFNAHWKAVIDEAKKEPIPTNVLAIAGNDALKNERARVILVKLRLMEAFPMSFDEIDSRYWTWPMSTPADFAALSATPPNNPKSLTANPVCHGVHFYLSGKVNNFRWEMIKQLQAAQGPAAAGPKPATLDLVNKPHESATCLLLALKVKRKGLDFNEGDFAANIRDIDSDGLKEFLDSFFNPVFFYRFGWNNPVLDAANPVQEKPAPGVNAFDGLDNKGTLIANEWYVKDATSRQYFERSCHPIYNFNKYTGLPGQAKTTFFVRPAIVSAGRDFDPVTPHFGLGIQTPYHFLYGVVNPSLAPGMAVVDPRYSGNNIYNLKD